MKTNRFLALAAIFGLALAFTFSCSSDDGGDSGEIVRPNVIDGYYGVTFDGKTIEVLVNWSTSNAYTIKVDGSSVSQGTATNSGGIMTFTPSDNSAVTVTGYAEGGEAPLVSVENSGTTYTAQTMSTASDYYYCVGAATGQSSLQIQQLFAGKTPEQIYSYYLSNPQYFDDYDAEEGTFDEIVEFAQYWKCPNSELSRISNEMNSGKFFGVGYYTHPQYGNIVFFISKIQMH